MGHRNKTLKGGAKQNFEQVRSEKVIDWLCFQKLAK